MKLEFTRKGSEKQTKYQTLVRVLTVITTILLVIVVAVPGALRLMYRADAQVALGNAKAVRLALQTVATEAYGLDRRFGDSATECGITESLIDDVYLLANVPGEYMVLRTDESGYHVKRFLYIEGNMMVMYDDTEGSYEVSHIEPYIKTKRQQ